MDNNELFHHGTKGQRWGLRRYQNSDGSLTPAGRQHYGVGSERKSGEAAAKQKAKVIAKNTKAKIKELKQKQKNDAIIEKARAKAEKKLSKYKKKEAAKEVVNEVKKTAKEMSNEELRREVERLRLVKDYELLQPKREKGKSFISTFKDQAIKPAVTNAGKDILEKWLKKTGENYLKLNEKPRDPYADMQKAIKNATIKRTYEQLMAEEAYKQLMAKEAEKARKVKKSE